MKAKLATIVGALATLSVGASVHSAHDQTALTLAPKHAQADRAVTVTPLAPAQTVAFVTTSPSPTAPPAVKKVVPRPVGKHTVPAVTISGVRTVNEAACPSASVQSVGLNGVEYPTCYIAPRGNEVATCIDYRSDGTWGYSATLSDEQCPSGPSALVDPAVLS